METKSNLTILLLGSGAREHTQAWKLRQSSSVAALYCAPGNPGMAQHGELRSCSIEDPESVLALATELAADLVFIGPEAPLAAGVADVLREKGFPVFGPNKAAARLEWDKAFSKAFMDRNSIPTAASRTFDASQVEEAVAYLTGHELPVVLKANGLAAGKGVVIAATTDEAVSSIREMLGGTAFGSAGETVVVEEFMQGEEASVFVVTDGEEYVVLAPSQDHKRVGDGDTGPNTGGMGAYAPAPVVTTEVMERVRQEIIEPTLRGMKTEGAEYSGCLYVGLMINNGTPRVVEFNSRFGDPETQVVLPLLDADFAALSYAVANRRLREFGEVRSHGTAVCIVMASEGYPGSYPKGVVIEGTDIAGREEGIVVFHAGTALSDGRLVTAGGRVLGVTAVSGMENDFTDTIARAYHAVESISFTGAHYRKDIGYRVLTASEPM